MKVFFVRHGESQSNLKGLYQHADVTLTPRGENQAKKAAHFFRNRKFDKIISSPHRRAVQTAQIIQQAVPVSLEYSNLLVELRNPSEIVGKPYLDPLALKIKALSKQHADDPTWHYSDEENSHELMVRARQALFSLERYGNQRVIVVTHGAILKMIISVMVFGKSLTLELFSPFDELMEVYNTAIAICERTQKGWKLLTWNQISSLGQRQAH